MSGIATARALTGLLHDLTDEEILELTESDNRPGLKEFLLARAMERARNVSIAQAAKLVKPSSFPTTYDCSLGLKKLIKRAVGPNNLGNINSDITQERFPLNGTGVRTMNLRVEPFLNNETGEQAAKRLITAGHILANTGDLAGFQHDHPKEVERWSWVVALSEDSRWSLSFGNVMVPYASVHGASRYFDLDGFRGRFYSCSGVLVRCE